VVVRNAAIDAGRVAPPAGWRRRERVGKLGRLRWWFAEPEDRRGSTWKGKAAGVAALEAFAA